MLDISNVGVYLDAPLDPEEKIPLSDLEWRELLQPQFSVTEHFCSPEDLGLLFTKNEDETAHFMWPYLAVTILGAPPNPPASEASFHSFWDHNIVDILVQCLGKRMWTRNSYWGTHTGEFRPDLGLYLQSACIFRGEEKEPMFIGKHPRQELAEKTRWVYDPAPYVLGVYFFSGRICC